MNVVTVTINGIEYNLKGEEKEEYLHKVAGYVDKKIKNIMNTNEKLSTASAAVLTAVNIVDELFKYDKSYSEITLKVEKMLKNEKLLTEQIHVYKKNIIDLEHHSEDLQKKLKEDLNQILFKQKEEELAKLNKEFILLQEASQKTIADNNALKSENKELKVQVQSAKFKFIGLQNKLIDTEKDLTKYKNASNSL